MGSKNKFLLVCILFFKFLHYAKNNTNMYCKYSPYIFGSWHQQRRFWTNSISNWFPHFLHFSKQSRFNNRKNFIGPTSEVPHPSPAMKYRILESSFQVFHNYDIFLSPLTLMCYVPCATVSLFTVRGVRNYPDIGQCRNTLGRRNQADCH